MACSVSGEAVPILKKTCASDAEHVCNTMQVTCAVRLQMRQCEQYRDRCELAHVLGISARGTARVREMRLQLGERNRRCLG